MKRAAIALAVASTLLAASCNGHAVLVEKRTAAGTQVAGETTTEGSGGKVLSKGGKNSLNLGAPHGANGSSGGSGSGQVGTAQAGDANCATNSNPDQGFTDDSLKFGTIIPLTGALRPLGEQVERVMKVSVDAINHQTHIPGYDLNWGCPSRPGIYGRKLSVSTFSLNANTPEEALAGMRRLVDVEHVFSVRDCYLESNLMGPATQYQNSKGVPGVWCFFSEMPYPSLAPWNFAPGVDPLVIAAVHTAYLIKKMDRTRIGILADPSTKNNIVAVVRKVAQYLHHPIPTDCIVYKKSQEADSGERSEIAQLRTCYGAQDPTDAVFFTDALNGTFGPLEARDQGWTNVQFACETCWIWSLADLCGQACAGMLTDCQALPCIPWADPKKYPAAAALNDTYHKYLSREAPDVLTYGPAAITGGISLWLAMTGPELSREAFAHTMGNLHNWDAGIGPILNTNSGDHFGGASTWIIKFTGSKPWFDDVTGRFVTLDELGIPRSVATR